MNELHGNEIHDNYIQMALFLETPKWESQNWDSYYPKTLDTHIFLKSSLFGACGKHLITLRNIFPTMYCRPQLEMI